MASEATQENSKNAELALLDAKGKEIGKKAVSAEVFANKAPQHLIHQVIRWQRAKRRAGTHSTQTRAEMTGGGKKPWKQKGTGNARAGSNTSPLWVGGGIAHGPKPRDYEFRLNKQERKRALSGALTARQNEGRLFLVSDFGLEDIKTKNAQKVLQALGIQSGESAIVVVSEQDQVTAKSLRNIDRVKVLIPAGLNPYDVIATKYLIITEGALPQVEQRFSVTAAE
jgi:large subunit ribosomal protein L4